MAMNVNGDEARAWLERWEQVDRRSAEEMRALTPEAKFRQLVSLMDSRDLWEWSAARAQEEQRVREIWMRLHVLGRT